MLEKISNISSGSEYSKSVKTKTFGNALGAAYNKKVDSHDSVNISPALQYLNQINWRLKELKHGTDEKIFIDYIISDIEFQTTIELPNISALSSLAFKVIKDRNGNNWKSRTVIDIVSRLDDIAYNESPSLINFSALNIFFQRIFDMNIYRELSSEDEFLINELVSDLKYGMKNEFEHMNGYLFTFIDKLTGMQMRKGDGKSDLTEQITIKKIKVLNAE